MNIGLASCPKSFVRQGVHLDRLQKRCELMVRVYPSGGGDFTVHAGQ